MKLGEAPETSLTGPYLSNARGTRYMKSAEARNRHRRKCELNGQPPGTEIYRSGPFQVWEIDGAASKVRALYDCQTHHASTATFTYTQAHERPCSLKRTHARTHTHTHTQAHES